MFLSSKSESIVAGEFCNNDSERSRKLTNVTEIEGFAISRQNLPTQRLVFKLRQTGIALNNLHCVFSRPFDQFAIFDEIRNAELR